MQHAHEHRTLQREAKAPFAGQLSEHPIDAQLLPQALEDQSRSNDTGADRDRIAFGVRAQHRQLLREAPQ